MSRLLGLSRFGSPIGRSDYYKKVLTTAPLAYWPMWESSGGVVEDISGNGYNGTYTGVTLGKTGIGDGRTCPAFDGVASFADVHSGALQAAFNGSEGSLMIWDRIDDTAFNDLTARRAFFAEAPLVFLILATTGLNANRDFSIRGNVAQVGSIFIASLPTSFQCMLITWSVSSNRVRYYRNGVSSAAEDISAGAWGNQPTAMFIGATNAVPTDSYLGRLAHTVLWTRELNTDEALSIGRV